jgi:hypothetical protein
MVACIIFPKPVKVVSIIKIVGPTINTNASNKNDNHTLIYGNNFNWFWEYDARFLPYGNLDGAIWWN